MLHALADSLDFHGDYARRSTVSVVSGSYRVQGKKIGMAQRMTKFQPQKFLEKVGNGKTTLTCPKKRIIFLQGDSADAVFYIQTGQVKLTVISSQGKEAIVAPAGAGELFRGRVSRWASGVDGHGRRYGKIHARAH